MLARLGCASALLASASARADDADALSLEAAPAAAAPATPAATRVFVEGALGRIAQRYDLPSLSARRASLDITHNAKWSGGWRATVSDRLDSIHPADDGMPSTLNSLREAFVGWQSDAGATLVEFGRINLRHGTAYGFNPTDVFREGSLRAYTTSDPIALRENRLGTVMLRAQRQVAGGAVSLAFAPKLADEPSNSPFNLDLGATNQHQQLLLTLSQALNDKVNGQLMLSSTQGRGVLLGASASALLSDALVAHVEWTRSRAADALMQGNVLKPTSGQRDRVATGLTFTTASHLSLTGEYAYNGLAPDNNRWSQADLTTKINYLIDVQRRQDNASRGAYLLYATQKDSGIKNLDITALLRVNANDHSRLGWLEARYHWQQADLALQWQQTSGGAGSEYGLVPYRRTLQVLGTYYF
jgi:hypothetical protein